MAEAAVLLALGKLVTGFAGSVKDKVNDKVKDEVVSFLSKEVVLLWQELPALATRIERELYMIHNFLSQVGSKVHNNKVLDAWVVRVRKVAYRIEDIMDEYLYYESKLQEDNFIMKQLHRSIYATSFHCIATGLKAVDDEIKHLTQLKKDYAEMFSELTDRSSVANQVQLSRDDSFHAVKDDDFVGMKEDMQLLDGWLDPKEATRTVISVWGFGGLGKTTLVRKVYEFEKELKSFDCYAWIIVPQNYNTDGILRQLIRELSEDQSTIPIDLESMYRSKLNDALRGVLSNKKYLIVLDDVWETKVFQEMSNSLVDDHNGSRIIITTRNSDVASLALETYKLKLKPLGDEEAFKLFCRKAFQKCDMTCPSNLKKLSKQIVSKCGGLPLAINAIGNVLAVQEPTETVWKRMDDQFQCELEDNPGLDEIRSALSVSFSYLPRHLKNCFLYCSMFPEDHQLSREQLVRLWIAEGFITKRGASTLEEVADGYLTDLIRGSMLQLVEADELGRVAFCKMHDIVRDLALSFSRKERFGLADVDIEAEQKDDARRLTMSKYNQQIGSSLDLPRLRTFIATNGAAQTDLLSTFLHKSKYLSVLELQDSPIDTIPANIGDLFNLHYLGLRRTKVKSLPRSIARLSNLETLDLKSTEIATLPNEISKLNKLRHLFAEMLSDRTRVEFRYFRGVVLPSGFSHLSQLQTLETVEASKESLEQLARMTELRTLWVDNVQSSDCEQLFSSLSKMDYLSSLLINAANSKEALDFEAFCPEKMKMELQKLIIRGSFADRTFENRVFRKHGDKIKYLALSWFRKGGDPLPSLALNLPNLVFLSLRKGCCDRVMVIGKGSFPHLKTLFLGDMDQVEQIVIEQGALKSLEALYLVSLIDLKEIPKGLEHVAPLKKLSVWKPDPEFKTNWERENWNQKLHHVPEIRVSVMHL